jgi:hypothetical protein
MEAVGFTRVIAAAQESLAAFVQLAWPSLLGLVFVGLVLAYLGEERAEPEGSPS